MDDEREPTKLIYELHLAILASQSEARAERQQMDRYVLYILLAYMALFAVAIIW